MKQYINKSAVVAEIESKRNRAKILGDNAINSSMQQFYDGMKQSCVDILSFIDTLEMKEVKEEPVSEELEEEIHRYYVDWDEHPLYVQTARHFANWQKENL